MNLLPVRTAVTLTVVEKVGHENRIFSQEIRTALSDDCECIILYCTQCSPVAERDELYSAPHAYVATPDLRSYERFRENCWMFVSLWKSLHSSIPP